MLKVSCRSMVAFFFWKTLPLLLFHSHDLHAALFPLRSVGFRWQTDWVKQECTLGYSPQHMHLLSISPWDTHTHTNGSLTELSTAGLINCATAAPVLETLLSMLPLCLSLCHKFHLPSLYALWSQTHTATSRDCICQDLQGFHREMYKIKLGWDPCNIIRRFSLELI